MRGLAALAELDRREARRRRADLHRGRLGDADRRRDRRQRHPRQRGRARQLPLRRPIARPPRPRRCSQSLVPADGDARDRRQLAARAASSPTHPLVRAPARRGRLAGSSPSRRGRPSPSSPRAGIDAVNFGPGDAALRPPPRRARRDRRARALLRDAAAGAREADRAALPDPRAHRRRTRSSRLDRGGRGAPRAGLDVIDFGIGEPREPTARASSQALRDGVRERMGYPAAPGLPELREAIAAGSAGASASRSIPTTEVDPDARLARRRSSPSRRSCSTRPAAGPVVVTEPGYPGRRRAAPRSPARAWSSCRCSSANGFLPDLDAVDGGDWRGPRCVWLNYPNNPTGARRRRSRFYERAAALAREHDFVLASDEAYTRALVRGEPPASALQLADRTNVVVFNTLSKRSSMPGYRSGLRRRRPGADRRAQALPPERRHRAAGVRPARVGRRLGRRGARRARSRARYRAKRERSSSTCFGAPGCASPAGRATIYLWVRGAGRRDARGARDRACSSTASSSRPGSYLRPVRRGLRAARARPDRGRVRARRRDPARMRCCTDLAGSRAEIEELLETAIGPRREAPSRSRRRSRLLDARRGARRGAARRTAGTSTSGRRRRSSSTSGCARSSRSRSAASSSSTRSR